MKHCSLWDKAARKLETLPLIDEGFLSPYNRSGYGSVVISEKRIDFDSPNARIRPAPKWGVIKFNGRVPEHLLKLPTYSET